MPTTLPALRDLRSGQSGIIEDVACAPEDCARLAAMGVCCGAYVRVLTAGAACSVQVGETRLVLRGHQTAAIRVSPL